jgi:hypothetical protein
MRRDVFPSGRANELEFVPGGKNQTTRLYADIAYLTDGTGGGGVTGCPPPLASKPDKNRHPALGVY